MDGNTNPTDLVKQSVSKVIQAAQSMDDAALAAVKAAELAGQNRSTLIEWIEGEQKERETSPGNTVDTEEYLAAELEKLGYARDGGPQDASYAEKAIFALIGVSADRDSLRNELTSTGDALKLSEQGADAARLTAHELQTQLDAVSAENDLLKAEPVLSITGAGVDGVSSSDVFAAFGGKPGGGKTAAMQNGREPFDGYIPPVGATVVMLDVEGKRIDAIPAQMFGPGQFRRSGRSVTLDTDIEFSPTLGEVEIAAVALVEFETDDVREAFAQMSLVQPFAVGGGRNAKLPAGTLTFR